MISKVVEQNIRVFFLVFIALTRYWGLLIVRTDFVQRSFQYIRRLRRNIYMKERNIDGGTCEQ